MDFDASNDVRGVSARILSFSIRALLTKVEWKMEASEQESKLQMSKSSEKEILINRKFFANGTHSSFAHVHWGFAHCHVVFVCELSTKLT